MSQRLLTFAVFGIVLVALGEWGLRSDKFPRLDELWLEFCVGNAGESLRDPAVTVIRIDDGYEPLRIGGDDQAPRDGTLSRLDYATILAFVAKLQPRAVAFLPTPTFDENLTLNKTDIAPLKDASMQLPRMEVASTVSNDGEQAKESVTLDYPAVAVEGDPASLLAFTRTIRFPDPQILENGTPLFKAIESERDLGSNGIQRIPLVARLGDRVVPSLALAAVAHHAGVAPASIVVKLDDGSPRVLVGELPPIPIAADGTFTVPARAGLMPSMTRVVRTAEGEREELHLAAQLTVDELAYTGEKDDEVAKRIVADLRPKFDSVRDNLVLVGFDRTADRRLATVKGEMLSETGLTARAIAAIQSGRHIHWLPNGARWIALLVLAVVGVLLFRLPRGKFLPAALIAGLVYFGALVFLFAKTLSWTPPFAFFSLFGLIVLVGLIVPASPRSKSEFQA